MDRIDWLYRTGELLVSAYIRTNYTLHFEGTLPRNGPYVLLPKHQKMLDIPIEGHYIRRRTGRLAYFVMRGFEEPRNTLFEALGGITIARAKDLREGKVTKEEGHKKNEEAATKVLSCLARGEPVVIHPEGTRHYKEMGEIRIKPNSIIARIIEKYNVPFIPMGIEYDRSHIHVKTGEPISVKEPSQLETIAANQIAKLSNLQP
jgi:1-acyl-sn-glycerol-3-phosphate acyltransferase